MKTIDIYWNADGTVTIPDGGMVQPPLAYTGKRTFLNGGTLHLDIERRPAAYALGEKGELLVQSGWESVDTTADDAAVRQVRKREALEHLDVELATLKDEAFPVTAQVTIPLSDAGDVSFAQLVRDAKVLVKAGKKEALLPVGDGEATASEILAVQDAYVLRRAELHSAHAAKRKEIRAVAIG